MRPVEGAMLIADEVSATERHTKELNKYLQDEAIVLQQITSTIPDTLYLKIKGKEMLKMHGTAWKLISKNTHTWSL